MRLWSTRTQRTARQSRGNTKNVKGTRDDEATKRAVIHSKKKEGKMEERTIHLLVFNKRGGNFSRSFISPIHMQRRLVALEKRTKTSSSMLPAAAADEQPLQPRTCSIVVIAGTAT